MNVRELMILALTDLVSAAPKKELQDDLPRTGLRSPQTKRVRRSETS